MTALEHDILAALREQDLEVHQLRAELKRGGHEAAHGEVYACLAHLEASAMVRLDAGCFRPALWGAR